MIKKHKENLLDSFFVPDDYAGTPVSAKVVDIPEDEYHNDFSRVSKSMLSVFCKSPVEYYEQFITRRLKPKAATEQMNLGTVCHAVLLEGKRLEDLVVVIPPDCLTKAGAINSRGDAYKQFESENVGKVLVKDDRHFRDILAAIYASPLKELVENATERERVIHWTDRHSGLECRMKPDFFQECEGGVVCYDLKFSPLISDDDFSRSNKRFRYWLQDAHYSAGLAELYGKPVTFRFCVVEPVYPHRIVFKSIVQTSREDADRIRIKKLEELAECKSTNIWQDRWTNEIVMSPWDFNEEMESELEINWSEEAL